MHSPGDGNVSSLAMSARHRSFQEFGGLQFLGVVSDAHRVKAGADREDVAVALVYAFGNHRVHVRNPCRIKRVDDAGSHRQFTHAAVHPHRIDGRRRTLLLEFREIDRRSADLGDYPDARGLGERLRHALTESLPQFPPNQPIVTDSAEAFMASKLPAMTDPPITIRLNDFIFLSSVWP